jgi:hypothetical protein
VIPVRQVYLRVGVIPLGFLLNLNAFQAGTRFASALAIITTADPLVSITYGIVWFREQIAPTGNCGICAACREGDFIHCAKVKTPGFQYPGGFADATVVPATALARIPDRVTAVDAAPMGCAGVATFNSLRRSAARPGDLVAVLGLGGLGHLGVQFAWKVPVGPSGPMVAMRTMTLALSGTGRPPPRLAALVSNIRSAPVTGVTVMPGLFLPFTARLPSFRQARQAPAG